MKKMILTLAIAMSTFAAFAGEENVNQAVLKSFQTEFAGAENVSWTTGRNSFKAAFVMNGQHVVAYYDFSGTLLGLTRNISSLDLPMSLQADLKKNYKGYWISDLFEVNNQNGTTYYITLEKADESMILEANDLSSWDVYKRASKS